MRQKSSWIAHQLGVGGSKNIETEEIAKHLHSKISNNRLNYIDVYVS
jgi:hypothetical protein